MLRSFCRVRKFAPGRTAKALQGICCWCLAEFEAVRFEGFTSNPAWLATTGRNPAPWTCTPSVMRSIPRGPDEPSFLKPDLFHLLNTGVQKDLCGLSLVLMLAEFQGSNNDERMASLNVSLKAFLENNKLYLHCHRLSMDLIGAGKNKTYTTEMEQKPGFCGFGKTYSMGYSGGSTCRCQWATLEIHRLSMRGPGRLHATLYAQAVFMDKIAACHAAGKCFHFLLCYSKLVEWSIEKNRLLYNLTQAPLLVMELLTMSQHAASERVFDPLCNSTAQCEDFIGRISRLSRRVSAKQPHTRTLRRYQAALSDRLGLLG